MKTTLTLCLIFLLASCYPESTIAYRISNSTQNNIEVICTYKRIDVSDTLYISSKTKKTWKSDTDTETPPKWDLTVFYDSIVVNIDDKPRIIYRPETWGKNIYNYDYWTEHRRSRRSYEYTFEITEEDIAGN